MCASDQSEPSPISDGRPLGADHRVRGSASFRFERVVPECIQLGAVPDDARPRVRGPGLYRFCRVGNPKAEQDNRTTEREENLVRAADIHPFLCDAMGDRRAGSFAFWATFRARNDGGMGGVFALPAGRRLRHFRSDSRVLHDSFFHEIQYQAGNPCPLTTTTKANSPHFAS